MGVKAFVVGLMLATGVHAGQATVTTDVPYPTQWSQPQVLPDGRVVPAVPTRFQTREVGVQFAPQAPASGPAGQRPRPDVVAPLVAAAAKGDTNSVKMLLVKGVDINHASANGANALMVAAVNGRVEMVKLLLANNAEVNEVSTEGKTALIYAAEKGHAKIVRMLLEAGADQKVMDEAGRMAVEYAAAGNFAEVVALLQDKPVKQK
ncbi:MAG: hypothetical protein PCFJNLEI_01932 [Verrucomicrobiae bacterium]|nr:hypothetical protein [Verrucomicrobiae bacterium]